VALKIDVKAHFASASTVNKVYVVYVVDHELPKYRPFDVVQLDVDGAAANKKWSKTLTFHKALKNRIRMKIVAVDASGKVIAKKSPKLKWQP